MLLLEMSKKYHIRNEAGRQLWWAGRTLQGVMNYITAGDNPRLRYPNMQSGGAHRRGSSHERHMSTMKATTTMTTTTSTSIIGLGRSMTKIVRTTDPLLSFCTVSGRLPEGFLYTAQRWLVSACISNAPLDLKFKHFSC